VYSDKCYPPRQQSHTHNKEANLENTSYRTRYAMTMKESGMQVTQIATTLGVHRSTIYRWVNDKGSVSDKRPSKLDPYKAGDCHDQGDPGYGLQRWDNHS
jgi:DNA invertase Pin-like site-specific DNA recombinase